ncbi:hypothetical protein ONZ45_g12651 [Pleurotus djamor]|nr:hypothetical protein ONZ45_g12651 [Pleurotus djamor]
MQIKATRATRETFTTSNGKQIELFAHSLDGAAPSHSTDPRSRCFSLIPQLSDASEEIEGLTSCVFRSTHDKSLFTNVPGYPRRIPRPLYESGGYVIKPSPGKGLGMFATRDFAFGDIIISERPLLISSAAISGATSAPEEPGKPPLKLSEFIAKGYDVEASVFEFEDKLLDEALGRISGVMERFLALHDCHADERTSGPLFGRLRTNGFKIPIRGGTTDYDLPYTAAHEKLSRINHSCSPNSNVHWDAASVSHQCFAIRPIAKGEEITTHYISLIYFGDKRKDMLRDYRITSMRKIVDELTQNIDRPIRLKLILRSCREAVELAEKEGQEGNPVYRPLLHGLACCHLAVGEEDECKRLLQKRRMLDIMHGMNSNEEVVKDVAVIRSALASVRPPTASKGKKARAAK